MRYPRFANQIICTLYVLIWSDLSGDQYLIKSIFFSFFTVLLLLSCDVSPGLTGWFSLVKFTISTVTMIDSLLISLLRNELEMQISWEKRLHITLE